MKPTLRPYRETDAPALAQLYRDAASVTGSQVYSPEQVMAWASFADDVPAFRARLLQGVTLVADMHETPVAFGQLDPADHLALLYTSPKFSRRGIGAFICRALEDRAAQTGQSLVQTEASLIAHSFFLKMGYSVDAHEIAEHKGLTFARVRMSKILGDRPMNKTV